MFSISSKDSMWLLLVVFRVMILEMLFIIPEDKAAAIVVSSSSTDKTHGFI